MTISCATCGREHTPESHEYALAQAWADRDRRRARLWRLLPAGIFAALGVASVIWQAIR